MKIPAGRINKLFGTDGGVMLSLYEAFPDDFDPAADPLFVQIDGLDVPLWCARFERRGRAGATAAFDDLDTPRRAQELVGKEFWLCGREEGPVDEDEFYLEDLIGFAVKCTEPQNPDDDGTAQTATYEGTVTDYFDSDANPLFELRIDGRTVLVPAAGEFIARIDFESRTMKMVLPCGLLDLQ